LIPSFREKARLPDPFQRGRSATLSVSEQKAKGEKNMKKQMSRLLLAALLVFGFSVSVSQAQTKTAAPAKTETKAAAPAGELIDWIPRRSIS
jgi:hypothetical protein